MMMAGFQFQTTELENLLLITPLFLPDQRGYFAKVYESQMFSAHGIQFELAEELESLSCQNTLRGLHFQRRHSQDKLVRVLSGEVYDVAVDLRPDSPTFGRWQGFYLSADNRKMLYIPKQFAHGFLVRSQEAVIHYLCGDCYDMESESGIIWNDPELGINWPLEPGTQPLLSPRDQAFPTFAAYCRSIGCQRGHL